MTKKPRSTGPNGEVHAFTTNAREDLTDQEKARLFLERGGRCHKCKRKLRPPADSWIVEHMRALENGGTNAWSNLGVTCDLCFPVKNAEDDKIAKKIRHGATKHLVPSGERKKSGRPLAGTKASGLRKKMNGEVERR